MNPWAHIDQLKSKLAAEKAAAIATLKELKRPGAKGFAFTGDVASRLEFDGTHWIFPVSGNAVKSRTLAGLLTEVTALCNGTTVKVSVAEMEFTITAEKGGKR